MVNLQLAPRFTKIDKGAENIVFADLEAIAGSEVNALPTAYTEVTHNGARLEPKTVTRTPKVTIDGLAIAAETFRVLAPKARFELSGDATLEFVASKWIEVGTMDPLVGDLLGDNATMIVHDDFALAPGSDLHLGDNLDVRADGDITLAGNLVIGNNASFKAGQGADGIGSIIGGEAGFARGHAGGITPTGAGASSGPDPLATAGQLTVSAAGGTVVLETGANGGRVELGAFAINADHLRVVSHEGARLATAVGALDLTTLAAGDVRVDETDGLTLTRVAAADGAVEVHAGAGVVAQDVAIGADRAGNDITITAGGTGDILIGAVRAGANHGRVHIQAPRDVKAAGMLSVLQGVSADLTAGRSVNQASGWTPRTLAATDGTSLFLDGTTPIGAEKLTAADTIYITGNINLAQPLTLEADNIVITDGGSITSTGAALVLDAADSLRLDGSIYAPATSLELRSASLVQDPAKSLLTAAHLDLHAATGTTLSTKVDTLDAEITGAGALTINEADAITLGTVDVAKGQVAVSAAGAIDAEQVSVDVDHHANKIVLSSPAGISSWIVDAGDRGEVVYDTGAPVTTLQPPGEIRGHKWNDLDHDGVWDANEPGLAGVVIFLDTNGNGVLDSGETSTTTAADDPATAIDETGEYAFTHLKAGTYTVAEVNEPGMVQTWPATGVTATRTTTFKDYDLPPSSAASYSLAAAGKYVFVGVPSTGESGWGKVDVMLAETGEKIGEIGSLDAAYYNDQFGASIAVAGNLLLVGAPDAPGGGLVHVFDIDSGKEVDLWKFEGENQTGARFGAAMAVNGNLAVIGAPIETGGGALFFYDIAAGRLVNVVRNPNVRGNNDLFGANVAFAGDGKYLLAAAPGYRQIGVVYLLAAESGKTLLSYVNPSEDPAAAFGVGLAAAGEMVYIGAPGAALSGAKGSGLVAVYTVDGTKPLAVITNPLPEAPNGFGAALLVDQDRLVVGAPAPGGNGVSGMVDVLDLKGFNLLTTIPAPVNGDAWFGNRLLALGPQVLVASADDPLVDRSEVAFAYTLGTGGGEHVVNVAAGQVVANVDFGNYGYVQNDGEIHGRKWNDTNANGVMDAGEPGLAGVTIYLDLDNNGLLDAGEPFTVTAADDPATPADETGTYAFTGLTAGIYVVREVLPAGSVQTSPGNTPGRLFVVRSGFGIPIEPDTLVSGRITTPGATNVYTFELKAPARLHFDARVATSGLTWSLQGPGGRQVVWPRDLAYADSLFNYDPVLDLGAGTYTIEIAGFGDNTGSYAFMLQDLDHGKTIETGVEIKDELYPGNASALYRFEAAAGSRWYFDVTTAMSDDAWALVDRYGNLIFGPTALVGDQEGVVLNTGGVYDLIVSGRYDAAGAPFAFAIRPQPVPVAEPVPTGAVVEDKIGQPGEARSYRFTLDHDAFLLVDTMTYDATLTWTLSGPAGAVAGGGFADSRDQMFDLRAGDYVFTVDAAGDTTATYLFRLSVLDQGAPLTLGKGVIGSLNPGTQTDVYTLDLKAGQALYFDNRIAGNGTADWQLVDPYGNTVFDAAFSADQDHVVAAATGIYALLIRGENAGDPAAANYVFVVHGIDETPVDLPINTVVGDSIETAGDRDRYNFIVKTPGLYYFDALTARTDLHWTLTGPGGQMAASTFAAANGKAAAQPVLSLPVGAYQVEIDADGDATLEYQFMMVEVASVATPLSKSVNFGLYPGDSSAFFGFEAAAGDDVDLDLFGSNGADTYWRLIAPDGGTVFAGTPAADRALVSAHLPQAGLYFLVVEGESANTKPLDLSVAISRTGNTPAAYDGYRITVGQLVDYGYLKAYETVPFTFTLKQDRDLYFDSLTNDGSLAWSLEGAAGSVVKNRPLDAADGAAITGDPILHLVAGDYLLTVSASRSTPTNRLVFQLLDTATLPALDADVTIDTKLTYAQGTAGYRFLAKDSRYYFDSLSFKGNADSVWRLVDPYGNNVFLTDAATDGGGVDLTPGDTYLLLIEGGVSTYARSVPYALRVHTAMPRQYEIPAHGTISGAIATPGTVDTYHFTLAQRRLILVDPRTNDAALRWSLTGPAGNAFPVVAERGANAIDADGNNAMLVDLTPGDYYLRVRGQGDHTGSYSFQLTDPGLLAATPAGQVVSATIAPMSAQAYRLTAAAGDRLYLDSRGHSLAAADHWRLYDPFGTVIADSGVDYDLTPQVLALSGDYLLVLESRPGNDTATGGMDFSWYNHAPATPQAIAIGQAVTGAIDTPGKTITYGLDLAATRRLYFDSLSADSNIEWRLTGPAGTVTSWYFDGTSSYGESETDLTLTPGSYTITIDSYGDHTGTFAFRLLDMDAAPIFAYGETVLASLASGYDAGLHAFDVQAGDRLFFDSHWQGAGSPSWQVVAPSGERLVWSQGLDQDAGVVEARESGRYLVVVEGDYSGAALDYSFTVIREQTPPAETMDPGQTVEGKIAVPGAQSSYHFYLDSGRLLVFDSLTNDPDLRWSLQGADGVYVAETAFNNADAAGSGNAPLRLGPGSYTLTVSGVGDHTGAYAFRLLDTAQAKEFADGDVIEDSLAPGNETHLYSFVGKAGIVYNLKFLAAKGGDADAWWRVIDAYGGQVAAGWALTGSSDIFAITRGGRYTLLVEGGVQGQQALFVAFQLASVDGTTPDTITGSPMALDTPVTATISAGKPLDLVFTLTADSLIHMDAILGSSTSSWSLKGPQGQVVSDRLFTATDSFANADPIMELPAGEYQLTLKTTLAEEKVTMAVRDVSAGVMIDPGTVVEATLDARTLIYRFKAEAGSSFYFDSISGDYNATWRLAGPNGTPLGTVLMSRSAGYDADRVTLGQEGIYTLLFEQQLGQQPAAIAFNVVPVLPTALRSEIVEIDPATGVERNRFAAPSAGATAVDTGYDGGSLFYVDGTTTLYQLDAGSGKLVAAHHLYGYAGFTGVAVLGNRVYLNSGGTTLVTYDPQARKVTAATDLAALVGGAGAYGIAADHHDGTVLLLDSTAATVYRINPAAATLIDSFSFGGSVDDLAAVGGRLYWAAPEAGRLEVANGGGNVMGTIGLPFAAGLRAMGGGGATFGAQPQVISLGADQVVTGVDFGNYSPHGLPEVLDVRLTSRGIEVVFDRPVDPDLLNLYGSQSANRGAADMTVTGAATGEVRGSLILGDESTIAIFKPTTGDLAPDTYAIHLRLGPDGFFNTSGMPQADEGSASYDTTLTVTADPAVVVAAANVVAASGTVVSGPAVTLADGSGVTAAEFTLVYDPALLNVSGVNLGATLDPAAVTMHADLGTPGRVHVTLLSAAPLAAGPVELVRLAAQVPSGAAAGAAGLIDVTAVRLNNGVVAARGLAGLDVVALSGDASGNMAVDPADARLAARVGLGVDSGFDAYLRIDPVLVADLNANGVVGEHDASLILDLAHGLAPASPTAAMRTARLNAPASLYPGQDLDVALDFNGLDGFGRVLALRFELHYDPAVLAPAASAFVTLSGSVAAWPMVVDHDPATGRLAVVLYTDSSLPGGSGAIAHLAFTVRDDAPLGAATVALDQVVANEDQAAVSFTGTTFTVVQDTPVANPDAVSTDEDSALTILPSVLTANDTDPDPTDSLRVVAIDGAATTGAVTLNADGTITYDPGTAFGSLAVGETAVDSFRYAVADDNGYQAWGDVMVTVTGANDLPTAVADSVSAGEDAGADVAVSALLANDHDPDNHDVLSLTAIDTNGTIGLVTLSGGVVHYDPNGHFDALAVGMKATDRFAYTVSDGHGGQSRAEVVVTVNGSNDTPHAAGDVFFTGEDAALTILPTALLANDSDPDKGDLLRVSAVTATGTLGGVTLNADGSIVYDPTAAFALLAQGETRVDRFTYTVTDTGGAVADAVVSVFVRGANDAPQAVDDAAATNEDSAVNIDLLSNDVDIDNGAHLTITGLDTAATLGQVRLNADGSVDYDPATAFQGLGGAAQGYDSFTYTVSDEYGLVSQAVVTITINGRNDAPQLTGPAAVSVDEGQAVSAQFGATDVDGDPVTFSLAADAPAGAAIDPDTGLFTWTPADGDRVATIMVIASDGIAQGNTAFEVTVNNIAPQLFVAGSGQGYTGSSYSVNLASYDPGADTISQWIVDWGDGHTSTLDAASGSIGHVYSAPRPMDGDLDGDGDVDGLDLTWLAVNFNKTGSGLKGDINGDGMVNSTDLGLLAANYGHSGWGDYRVRVTAIDEDGSYQAPSAHLVHIRPASEAVVMSVMGLGGATAVPSATTSAAAGVAEAPAPVTPAPEAPVAVAPAPVSPDPVRPAPAASRPHRRPLPPVASRPARRPPLVPARHQRPLPPAGGHKVVPNRTAPHGTVSVPVMKKTKKTKKTANRLDRYGYLLSGRHTVATMRFRRPARDHARLAVNSRIPGWWRPRLSIVAVPRLTVDFHSRPRGFRAMPPTALFGKKIEKKTDYWQVVP